MEREKGEKVAARTFFLLYRSMTTGKSALRDRECGFLFFVNVESRF